MKNVALFFAAPFYWASLCYRTTLGISIPCS